MKHRITQFSSGSCHFLCLGSPENCTKLDQAAAELCLFSALCSFLTWRTLSPWRWRQYNPPKRHFIFYGLHCVTCHFSDCLVVFGLFICWPLTCAFPTPLPGLSTLQCPQLLLVANIPIVRNLEKGAWCCAYENMQSGSSNNNSRNNNTVLLLRLWYLGMGYRTEWYRTYWQD
jgi:hypothetical protein